MVLIFIGPECCGLNTHRHSYFQDVSFFDFIGKLAGVAKFGLRGIGQIVCVCTLCMHTFHVPDKTKSSPYFKRSRIVAK